MSKEPANHSEQPRMIKPMLAQSRSEPFNCDKPLFEVKWDGTRCISFIEDGRLRLQNRHLMDVGDRYPELAFLKVRGLPAGTVIDGEIVVLRQGRPSFQKLQQRDQDPSFLRSFAKILAVFEKSLKKLVQGLFSRMKKAKHYVEIMPDLFYRDEQPVSYIG